MAFSFNRFNLPVPSGSPWWMGILPWIVYGVGRAWWPVVAAPLVLAVTLPAARWAKIQWSALDIGVMAYFLLLCAISIVGWDQNLTSSQRFALCPAVLAVAAALSVATGRPFTLAYARCYAPAYIQERPGFFWSNQLISLLWAAGFSCAAVLIGFSGHDEAPMRATVTLIEVLGATAAGSAVIGFWFHRRESRSSL